MKPKDRQKMCSQCDGRIPFEATECPYCNASAVSSFVGEASPPQFAHHQALQDSLTSPYSPPYPAKRTLFSGQEEKKTTPSYQEVAPEKPLNTASAQIAALSEEEEKVGVWSIFAFSSGSLLLLLGLLQLFFSDKGRMHLEWDSSYWFFYCLAALPCLYYGYKKISTLK